MIGLLNKTNKRIHHDVNSLNKIRIILRRFACGGKKIEQKFLNQNIRATSDLRNEKIGAKIREGRLDLIPYLAVVGAKEEEANTLTLRSRKDGELGSIKVDDVVEKLAEEIKARTL
jgi:threonyl-tRNA synthetase